MTTRKPSKVPLMNVIYKEASRTVVWLGEPDRGTDLALDFMAEVTTYLKEGNDPITINRDCWAENGKVADRSSKSLVPTLKGLARSVAV
jgi:hypothetical protein